MTTKEYVLETMRNQGRSSALALQENASAMTGTELNAQDSYIPDFSAAKTTMNMLQRSAGFVCKSAAGRVVRLLQPYDSDIYPAEPEELPAHWGFVWSTDPAKALPFISLATSPYDIGDCCTENAITYRSNMSQNVHSPSAYPNGWDPVDFI